MNKKEKQVQQGLGSMFICVGCAKIKKITERSDGGIYGIDDFCLTCIKDTLPLSRRMILSERNYKAGYTVRQEFWDDRDLGGQGLFISNAYTPNGNWIGSTKIAYFLCKKRGIVPELKTSKSDACSIGYSPQDEKYYGWSHRAICGFVVLR